MRSRVIKVLWASVESVYDAHVTPWMLERWRVGPPDVALCVHFEPEVGWELRVWRHDGRDRTVRGRYESLIRNCTIVETIDLCDPRVPPLRLRTQLLGVLGCTRMEIDVDEVGRAATRASIERLAALVERSRTMRALPAEARTRPARPKVHQA